MSKEELYRQIQTVKSQIQTAVKEQKTLEEALDVLQEFSSKCDAKAESFMGSIQRRKGKLTSLSALINQMKAAYAYYQKMQEVLSGADYSGAKQSIDTLLETVSGEKRTLRQKIQNLDDKIADLRYRQKQLQYQYDNYEEDEDGEQG